VDSIARATTVPHPLEPSLAALLVTRNTKDFPSDDPGVRVPYTL
jgi:hypothetical protein